MKITRYVKTSKRKVFLENFYCCGILSVFGLFGMAGTSYSNYELTKAKRAGGWLGFLFSVLYLAVLIGGLALLKLPQEAVTIYMALVTVAYVVFLILFGVFHKVK